MDEEEDEIIPSLFCSQDEYFLWALKNKLHIVDLNYIITDNHAYNKQKMVMGMYRKH